MNDTSETTEEKQNYRDLYRNVVKALNRTKRKFREYQEINKFLALKNEKYSADKAVFMAQSNCWSLAADLMTKCLDKEEWEV